MFECTCSRKSEGKNQKEGNLIFGLNYRTFSRVQAAWGHCKAVCLWDCTVGEAQSSSRPGNLTSPSAVSRCCGGRLPRRFGRSSFKSSASSWSCRRRHWRCNCSLTAPSRSHLVITKNGEEIFDFYSIFLYFLKILWLMTVRSVVVPSTASFKPVPSFCF